MSRNIIVRGTSGVLPFRLIHDSADFLLNREIAPNRAWVPCLAIISVVCLYLLLHKTVVSRLMLMALHEYNRRGFLSRLFSGPAVGTHLKSLFALASSICQMMKPLISSFSIGNNMNPVFTQLKSLEPSNQLRFLSPRLPACNLSTTCALLRLFSCRKKPFLSDLILVSHLRSRLSQSVLSLILVRYKHRKSITKTLMDSEIP